MLSSGKDSLVKLWELSTSRCLIAYTGAGSTGKQVCQTIGVVPINAKIDTRVVLPGAPGPGRVQPDRGLRDVP